MPVALKIFSVEEVRVRRQPPVDVKSAGVAKLKQGTELLRTLRSLNLWGRHSDYIVGPACKDPNGVNPNELKQSYDFITPTRYLPEYKNPCWYQRSENGEGWVMEKLHCIPYFYIIGTTRSATTDLFKRILMHPHVSNVTRLEKSWFERERFKGLDKNKLEFYTEMFRESISEVRDTVDDKGYHYKIIGDDSPAMISQNAAWKMLRGNEWCQEPRVISLSHLHRLLPTARLILMVRDPVDRLWSDFLSGRQVIDQNATLEEFHVRAAFSIQSFEACLKQNPFRRCLYGPETFWNRKIIYSFTSGIYSRLLMDALQLFPRRNILVMRTEQYQMYMKANILEVFKFLNLDPLTREDVSFIVDELPYSNDDPNVQTVGDMLPQTRKLLADFYNPYNEELALLLNDNKYMWLHKQ